MTIEICDRITVWREFHGMSNAELARACGVSTPAVSQWELGQVVPTMDSIQAICDALVLTMEEFFGPLPLPILGKGDSSDIQAA